MKRFTIDGEYKRLLTTHGINVPYVLLDAGLDHDILDSPKVSMTEREYYSFMESIGRHIHDDDVPIRIATSANIESFNAPIYAAYCSKDGLSCVRRLSEYKKMIGPMMLIVRHDDEILRIDIAGSTDYVLPQFLVEGEIIFMIHLLRLSTGKEIMPLTIRMTDPVLNDSFIGYVGVKPIFDETNSITFDMKDMQIPFASHNESILDYLAPEIESRLNSGEFQGEVSKDVYHILMEILPSGRCTIEDVSAEMNVGKRTIQRKLSDEGTSFNLIIGSVRKNLSEYYIGELNMNADEISFILGYKEVNSFLRAFKQWNGMTVTEYRKQQQSKR